MIEQQIRPAQELNSHTHRGRIEPDHTRPCRISSASIVQIYEESYAFRLFEGLVHCAEHKIGRGKVKIENAIEINHAEVSQYGGQAKIG